jgi:hypothetical protein
LDLGGLSQSYLLFKQELVVSVLFVLLFVAADTVVELGDF